MGAGVGLLYEAGVDGCIYSCFCTTKSFGLYPLYVQNMYILIKQYKPYKALQSCKTEKKKTFVTQRH